MLVAITGATGFVGRIIVERLLRHDHEVRVLARDPRTAGWIADRGGQVVAGDLESPDALTKLLVGADAAIHLVGIIEEVGRQTFQRVHVEGTRAVVLACRQAGVKRLVHMSALGARENPRATAYHRTKAQAEELVRNSGLSYAIMRPAVIAAPGNPVLTMLCRMIRYAPVVPVIGDGKYKFPLVYGDDVAEAFALAAERPGLTGSYDLTGPIDLAYRDVLDELERALGVHRPRLFVPLPLAKAGVWIGALVPMIAPITPPQLQMLLEGPTTAHNALIEVFDIKPTPFADIAWEICGRV